MPATNGVKLPASAIVRPVEDRAARIRKLHEAVERGDRDILSKAIRLGGELEEEREACVREQRPWLARLGELGVPQRTAQDYRDIAKAYRPGGLLADSANLTYSESLIRVRAARKADKAEREADSENVGTGPGPEASGGSAADLPAGGDFGEMLEGLDPEQQKQVVEQVKFIETDRLDRLWQPEKAREDAFEFGKRLADKLRGNDGKPAPDDSDGQDESETVFDSVEEGEEREAPVARGSTRSTLATLKRLRDMDRRLYNGPVGLCCFVEEWNVRMSTVHGYMDTLRSLGQDIKTYDVEVDGVLKLSAKYGKGVEPLFACNLPRG